MACTIPIPGEAEFLFGSVYAHSGRDSAHCNLALLATVAAMSEDKQKHVDRDVGLAEQPNAMLGTDSLTKSSLSLVAPM